MSRNRLSSARRVTPKKTFSFEARRNPHVRSPQEPPASPSVGEMPIDRKTLQVVALSLSLVGPAITLEAPSPGVLHDEKWQRPRSRKAALLKPPAPFAAPRELRLASSEFCTDSRMNHAGRFGAENSL